VYPNTLRIPKCNPRSLNKELPQLPLNLSHRIGLRHMSRIGKSVCPSGEQIVNGDFENGVTGWNNLNAFPAYLSEAYAHSPTHSVFTYSDGTGFYQTINNIRVACVQSLTFWAISPYGDGTMQIIIKYSDATETSIEFTHSNTWVQRNVTSQLSLGKVINEVRFTSGTDNPTHIDDASLIGTG